MLQVLEERDFPVKDLRLLTSARSAGIELTFRGKSYRTEEVSARAFADVDIALFSAGSDASRQWAPVAVNAGAVVIDNSSAYRMTDGVPLIVPEVNSGDLPDAGPRIIANPNCSTIQMVVALKPLHDRYGLHRVVVTTYQSVSGAGKRGVDQLQAELDGGVAENPAFPHPIVENAIPHIAAFNESGFTVEEEKMINETRKILGDAQLNVSPTCVRIPVRSSHSEALHIEMRSSFELEDVRSMLSAFPGITVIDNPARMEYPLARNAAEKDDVFVGRLRRDPSVEHGLIMWVVSDSLRKGAATNAVQIAELWLSLLPSTGK